jgi:hypothetical protein
MGNLKMKYRKKPIVIEAHKFPFDPEVPCAWYEALTVETKNVGKNETVYSSKFFVKTLEGNHEVSQGDFVIKGIKGEFYPCKPDIFEMTYEAEYMTLRTEHFEAMKECDSLRASLKLAVELLRVIGNETHESKIRVMADKGYNELKGTSQD